MKTCMPRYSIAYQPVEDPENLQFHRSPLRSADPQFVAGLLSYQASQPSYTRSPVPEEEDAPRVPTKAEEASRKCQHVQYPAYASMAARILSFERHSPSYLYPPLTPARMAEAGLFCNGETDRALCFCCGNAFKNWLTNSIPLVEHSRWSPSCEYISHLRGKLVQRAAVNQQVYVAQRQENVSPTTGTGAVDSNLVPSDDDDTNTETTSLLEMGYTVSQVKKAVIKLRNTTGNMDVTAEDVLTLILDEERQGLVQPPPGRRPYIRVISSSSIAAPTSAFLPVHCS